MSMLSVLGPGMNPVNDLHHFWGSALTEGQEGVGTPGLPLVVFLCFPCLQAPTLSTTQVRPPFAHSLPLPRFSGLTLPLWSPRPFTLHLFCVPGFTCSPVVL